MRRLEAMRRAGAAVEREPDGTWIVAPDHVDQARAYESRQARTAPAVLQALSVLPLDRQAGADGSTWLDRELIAEAPIVARDAGFGRDVREALARRRQWLVEQELARVEQDRIVFRANLLSILRRRELAGVGEALSGELGLQYEETTPGQRVEGIYRRRLDLVSGRFAVIASSREFTLVPWRPVLERNLGKQVAGMARSGEITWKLGRRRRGPTVS